MAIEPIEKVWLVSPASDAPAVPLRLAEIGLVHVSDVAPEDSQHAAAISRLSADARDIEARIRKLNETLEILKEFSKTAREFLSNLIPTPIETTRAELDAALAAVDLDGLHQQAKELSAHRAAAEAAAAEAAQQLSTLSGFADVAAAFPAEGSLRWTRATLWLAAAKQARRVLQEGIAPANATLELLATTGTQALLASVCLAEHEAAVAAQLRDLGLEPIAPPEQATTLAAHVKAIEATRSQAAADAEAAVAELRKLAALRHQAELVLGHWEERRETALAQGKMAQTGRAAVLVGYVRRRDLGRFQAAAARLLPQVSIVTEPLAGDDEPPVSLRNHPVFRPAQFLVEMFGLPGYHQFDPSAFLMLSFIAFFGICLGDAIYGIVLLGMAWYLIRRYRKYPGVRSLFELLAWGSLTTFLVGVATGTWAADLLSEYIGKGNAIGRMVDALKLTDPLQKPLLALGIALFLGVANQFWGVTMKMYGCWRQGDRWGALFDGGLWLLLLPGLVMLIAKFFSPELPGWVSSVGSSLALTGAAGLVLTQGRHEKGIVAKAVVGLVSLYVIVGSYGAVAFIGDTLSYSRLLALGLTTAIVGMAVNIIGNMLNVDVVLLGVLLFAVVAAGGHFFNLLISGLGAFIHSARLIFVEFFGRFYSPGATRFAPLGATGGRIRVMD